jgi:MYXO-CTERM domain-containing protein
MRPALLGPGLLFFLFFALTGCAISPSSGGPAARGMAFLALAAFASLVEHRRRKAKQTE